MILRLLSAIRGKIAIEIGLVAQGQDNQPHCWLNSHPLSTTNIKRTGIKSTDRLNSYLKRNYLTFQLKNQAT